MATEPLSARNLKKHGMRRGAYDGANRRRFVLFVDNRDGTESRHEFDSKSERDQFALQQLLELTGGDNDTQAAWLKAYAVR